MYHITAYIADVPHMLIFFFLQAFYVLVSLSAVCSKSKKWDQYLIYRSEEVGQCYILLCYYVVVTMLLTLLLTYSYTV